MPNDMLTQAIANLEAVDVEMRDQVSHGADVVSAGLVRCWADRVLTAVSDLKEVQGSVTVADIAFADMTLRDYFAAKALPIGWEIEKEAPTGPYSQHMEPTYLGAAQRAYFLADAMLKARAGQS